MQDNPSSSLGFLTRSDTNLPVHSLKKAISLDFESVDKYYTVHLVQAKALISCAVTAQLICAFVFAYTEVWFYHEMAQLTS